MSLIVKRTEYVCASLSTGTAPPSVPEAAAAAVAAVVAAAAAICRGDLDDGRFQGGELENGDG